MNHDYTGEGVDQIQEVIKSIKNNPHGRRHLVVSYNPKDLPGMCLPPCHALFQFYVANGELSLTMYQRSADMGLGVPFNVTSYSVLTYMVAQVCGLKPGEFIHMLGDTHVYLNHVNPLKEQLTRTPFDFPTLKLNPEITDIEKFTYKDFTLENYKCHKPIKMQMSV